MKTLRVIDVLLYGADGVLEGGEEFMSKYWAQRRGRTTTFAFSDEGILTKAVSLLAKYRLGFELFYRFELDPNEIATYPAIYFGIHMAEDLLIGDRVNETKLNQFQIAVDYKSERIVVTPRTKELLQTTSTGLQWELTEGAVGRELVFMTVIERLPDPIVVPSAVYVGCNEYPPGTYAVRSDGRDVITDANISRLAEAGLCVSEAVTIGSEVLKWRPRLVASGAVIHALQSAKAKGLLEPVSPLIRASHPLAAVLRIHERQ